MSLLCCCAWGSKVTGSWKTALCSPPLGMKHGHTSSFQGKSFDCSGQNIADKLNKLPSNWSFLSRLIVVFKPKIARNTFQRKSHSPSASWVPHSQIAGAAFTFGTIAVLPFYTLMVLAPNAELTRRSMKSNVPYVLLCFVYALLLYLSWTPDTFGLLFASKYWLPELPGITKMFSNEITTASAWLHLLAVDLFAARQVYQDGLNNKIDARLSVLLCLFSCPIGILIHLITKLLAKKTST